MKSIGLIYNASFWTVAKLIVLVEGTLKPTCHIHMVLRLKMYYLQRPFSRTPSRQHIWMLTALSFFLSVGIWLGSDVLWARSSSLSHGRTVLWTSDKSVSWWWEEDSEHQQMHLPALSLAIFWHVWEVPLVPLWDGMLWTSHCAYWKVKSLILFSSDVGLTHCGLAVHYCILHSCFSTLSTSRMSSRLRKCL